MRRISTLIFFTSACAFCFSQGVLTIEGHYQGENFYVQNPEHPTDTNLFCVDSVYVNDKAIAFLKASAFEIDLSGLELAPGDLLTIKVFHTRGCKPRILNPGPITPKASFVIVDIYVTPIYELRWTSRDEKYKIPYTVEAWRWNKWITIG